jgi:O-antigen/teichoic acid export membrane protein
LAIPLKGLVWVLGFIILAKGNNRLFLIVEVIANVLVLIFNILFYKYYGLIGLGVSLLISYAIVTVMMLSVLKIKYDFQFFKGVYGILIFSMFSLALCISSIYGFGYPKAYSFQAIIVVITFGYSLYELNRRMNLKEILFKLKSKISKK